MLGFGKSFNLLPSNLPVIFVLLFCVFLLFPFFFPVVINISGAKFIVPSLWYLQVTWNPLCCITFLFIKLGFLEVVTALILLYDYTKSGKCLMLYLIDVDHTTLLFITEWSCSWMGNGHETRLLCTGNTILRGHRKSRL